MIYCISLALQVAAGTLLLLWSFGKRNQTVLELYYPGSNMVHQDEDGMVTLCSDKLQKKYRVLLLNIFSFGNLVCGYLLSIFAEKNMSNCSTFLSVICATALILLLEIKLSSEIAKRRYPADMLVPYSELQSHGLDLNTNMTNAEIKRILDDTFGSNSE